MANEIAIQPNQYLTFTLGQELYAVAIDKVREVLDYTNITKVPRMPEFLRGIINLRGNVVAVIDLRLNLGMKAIERSVDTCIVIVEVKIGEDSLQLGALADSVQEVVDIEPEQIAPPPRIGAKLNSEFIKGMGKRDDKFVIILDIDKVLSLAELEAANSAISNVA
jgi:purine-binding chemotaxis protein CheW